MNAEQLLQHFERISEAPDAIPRLRRFILDLAVRGKLVEQDPSDEPATELLKRIVAEKAQLVKAGEIKKDKPVASIQDVDFHLPTSWTWTRLGNLTSYIQRGKSPKYAVSNGMLVVSQKCVQWSGLDLTVAKQITLESFVDYESIRFLRDGDLLWNSTGTGTIGRIIRVVDPPEKLVCDSHVTVVRCLAVVPEYIRAWLRSDQVYALIEDRAAGSTNQVELTAQMAINQIVPLPPLAEQYHIVAKVEELMSLCDQLEAAKAEREQCRDSLVAASLQGLNQPAEEEESFREHARFTFSNLPRLTTRAAHIKQLRQAILNLAVRGKLVEQDPRDSIKSFPPTLFGVATGTDQIPDTWLYVPLTCLLREDTRNGYSRKPDDAEDGVPILRISAGTSRGDGLVAEEEHKLISGIDSVLLSQYQALPGDLFACRFNGNKAYVGRLSLFTGYLGKRFIYPDKLIRIRLAPEIADPLFIRWMSSADLVREEIESKCATTVGNWGISAGRLKSCLFPLPPLAEQRRIVAKVDVLMSICDQLEAQIMVTEQDSRRFLESVLADALAPGIDLSAEAQVA